jgi:hypothetical protein
MNETQEKEMVWNSLNKQTVNTLWSDLKVGDVIHRSKTGSSNLIVEMDIVSDDKFDKTSRVTFLENERGLFSASWLTQRQKYLDMVVPNSQLHLACLKEIAYKWHPEMNTYYDGRESPTIAKAQKVLDEALQYYGTCLEAVVCSRVSLL